MVWWQGSTHKTSSNKGCICEWTHDHSEILWNMFDLSPSSVFPLLHLQQLCSEIRSSLSVGWSVHRYSECHHLNNHSSIDLSIHLLPLIANTVVCFCIYEAQLQVLLHVRLDINDLVHVRVCFLVAWPYTLWRQCLGCHVERLPVRCSHRVLLPRCLVRWGLICLPLLLDLQEQGSFLFKVNHSC